MANSIIEVENLSKLYRIGEINTGSLSHDLNRWWAKVTRGEDPYKKLSEAGDCQTMETRGHVWSLKDVNFSVQEGEVFGIVGKNGAGKSTLLKVLSKITKPSDGCIRIGGRIASLLEVGTGFHPDLSGRENVFLNGAILGMRKHEIKARFDEIVEFSGINRYIDTPVKRYSSGMFVRLAFAVAAHLEPEILIIDEVLAVGDSEFQEKCLGKMKDVTKNQGRTVIFVSHNLAAIKRLCDRGILLDKGRTRIVDSINNVLEAYQKSDSDMEDGVRRNIPQNTLGYFLDWRLEGQASADQHSCFSREHVTLLFRFQSLAKLPSSEFHVLARYDDAILFHVGSAGFSEKSFTLNRGVYALRVHLQLPVRQGRYTLEAGFFSSGKLIDSWRSSTRLNVLDTYEAISLDGVTSILNLKSEFSLEEVSPVSIPTGSTIPHNHTH